MYHITYSPQKKMHAGKNCGITFENSRFSNFLATKPTLYKCRLKGLLLFTKICQMVSTVKFHTHHFSLDLFSRLILSHWFRLELQVKSFDFICIFGLNFMGAFFMTKETILCHRLTQSSPHTILTTDHTKIVH